MREAVRTHPQRAVRGERWGFAVIALFAIAGVFSFLLLKEGGGPARNAIVLNGQNANEGVLYNYHRIRSERQGLPRPREGEEDASPLQGAGPGRTERNLESDRKGEARDAPSGSGSPGFIYHRVQRGESLWKIARKYNAEIAEIVRDNSIRNPNVIYAGSTLKIHLRFS